MDHHLSIDEVTLHRVCLAYQAAFDVQFATDFRHKNEVSLRAWFNYFLCDCDSPGVRDGRYCPVAPYAVNPFSTVRSEALVPVGFELQLR